MPHRTVVEEASRRRGRKISPELIEEILGSLGPGAIKAVTGVPKIFIGLTKGTPVGEGLAGSRFPVRKTLDENLESAFSFAKRARPGSGANIDRPSTIAGKKIRKNIGGRRPPDTELEALALRKQQAQRTSRQRAGKVEDVNLNKPGTLEPEVVEEIAKKGFGNVLTPSDLMNEVVKNLRVTNPARATRAEAIRAELTGMKSRGLSGNRKEREQIKNLLAEFTRLLGE